MPAMNPDGEYQIYSRSSGNSIWRFDAADINAALEALYYWRDHIRQAGTHPDNFGVRVVGGATQFRRPESEMQRYNITYNLNGRLVAAGGTTLSYEVTARSEEEARIILAAKLRDSGANMANFVTHNVEPVPNSSASRDASDSGNSDLPFMVTYRFAGRPAGNYRIDAPDQAQARAAFMRQIPDANRNEVEIVNVEQLR
jgi:hypothetical protein